MANLILCTMQTEHFEFTTLGFHKEHAKNLMNQAFIYHLNEIGMKWDEPVEPVEHYDANYAPISIGGQLRDNEPIKGYDLQFDPVW